MFSNTTVSVGPTSRILPTATAQSAAAPPAARAPDAPSAPATVESVGGAAFAPDVVQLSPGAKNAQQTANQATGQSVADVAEQARATEGQDVTRVREAIAELQKKTTSVTFDFADNSNRLVVRIVDNTTGEVVRQLPPEEMLKMTERLDALRGMLFQKTS